MPKPKRAGRVPDHFRGEISLRVAPWDWLSKARQLRRAADSLLIKFEEDHDRYHQEESYDAAIPDGTTVVMMLGFAVENLLKGLYVTTRNTEKIKTLRQLEIPGTRHELLPLADELKKSPLSIDFSKGERDILSVLEHTILWSGRYPCAVDIDDLIPIGDDGAFRKFYFDYPKDYFLGVELYNRMEMLLACRAQEPPRRNPFRLP